MITISVCIGSACHLKGAYNVIKGLENIVKNEGLEKDVEIKAAFCLGRCTEAVSVKVNDKIISVKEENVIEFFNDEIIRGIKK